MTSILYMGFLYWAQIARGSWCSQWLLLTPTYCLKCPTNCGSPVCLRSAASVASQRSSEFRWIVLLGARLAKPSTFTEAQTSPITCTSIIEALQTSLLKPYRKFVECVFKHNQQDTTLYNILYYCQCSTCFRRFLRPSSGAQNRTRSIGYLLELTFQLTHDSSKKQKKLDKYPMLRVRFWAPDDGRRNRLKHVEHSIISSFRRVLYVVCFLLGNYPKESMQHVEHSQQSSILCNVASCWLCLNTLKRCTVPWT